jgi:hypothetical protein
VLGGGGVNRLVGRWLMSHPARLTDISTDARARPAHASKIEERRRQTRSVGTAPLCKSLERRAQSAEVGSYRRVIGALIRFSPAASERYLPWHEDGCTLAEARERTADRALWCKWRKLVEDSPSDPEAGEVEREINTRFQKMLRHGRLVAVGRPESAAAETVIEDDFWDYSIDADWDASAVTANRRDGRAAFHDVRVSPIVHGPTRVEVLSGLTIVEVMEGYVLNDPEVVALSVPALDIDPALEPVLRRGHWSPHGVRQWPLQVSDIPLDGGEDEYLFGWALSLSASSGSPGPYIALRALEDRLEGLLGLLREGTLAVEGLPVRSGDPVRIPRSLWSHKDFRVDLENGDLCEEDLQSENPPIDFTIKRWSGLMICRRDTKVVRDTRAREPSSQGNSVPIAPPSLGGRRPQPKSDGVRTALKRSGIDLATDPRSASAIAADIVDLLPWSVSEGHQLAALVKIVSRLRRQRD